jgi:hypothetical protein
MKKYKITFTTDFYKEKNLSERYAKRYDLCKKWHNKSITFKELEENIKELGDVIFDGKTFEVYNDWRE